LPRSLPRLIRITLQIVTGGALVVSLMVASSQERVLPVIAEHPGTSYWQVAIKVAFNVEGQARTVHGLASTPPNAAGCENRLLT
jgi:hypothetical protein